MRPDEQKARDWIRVIRANIERDDRPEWNIYTEVIESIIELVDSLTAERDGFENRESDIYTAGYEAGEEAASRDVKQLQTQLAAMTAERDQLRNALDVERNRNR